MSLKRNALKFLWFIALNVAFNGNAQEMRKSNTDSEFGLKAAYRNYFAIGVAVTPRSLVNDELNLIEQNFNSLTAENAMKMKSLQPKEGVFNWAIIPTQVFGTEIAKRGNGTIVNISSMAAQRVITKVLGYSMAKTAIDCYTKWFAVELANRYGDKIRMNAIAPGFFLTEQNRTLLTNEDGSFKERGNLVVKQTPFKRFGTAQELEGALIYLLSDASRFVTGSIVNVDGGFAVFGGV